MLNTVYGTNCCNVVTGVVLVSLLSIVIIVDGVLRVFRFYVLCLVLYRIRHTFIMYSYCDSTSYV